MCFKNDSENSYVPKHAKSVGSKSSDKLIGGLSKQEFISVCVGCGIIVVLFMYSGYILAWFVKLFGMIDVLLHS